MVARTDNLMTAILELERVLGSQGQGQGADLNRALARLEEAARRHAAALGEPDGLIGPMDRPRIPSPGLDRSTRHLREQLVHILEAIRGLRTKARAQGQAPAVNPDPATLAGALPVAPEAGAVADHGALILRARQLAQTLEDFENREADVVLETVNTDVGAGD